MKTHGILIRFFLCTIGLPFSLAMASSDLCTPIYAENAHKNLNSPESMANWMQQEAARMKISIGEVWTTASAIEKITKAVSADPTYISRLKSAIESGRLQFAWTELGDLV